MTSDLIRQLNSPQFRRKHLPLSPLEPHSWDVDAEQAIAIQRDLAAKVIREADLGEVKLIAGVDMSATGVARAAVVVLSYPDLQIVEIAKAEKPLNFPYVPGLLSFREGPAVLAAFAKLQHDPDLIMFDGAGIGHPRRIGIAAHIGVLLDKPTIGVAKTRFIGNGPEPDLEPGSYSELVDKGEVIVAAVRTKLRTKPLFISAGHRMTLPLAVEWVLKTTRGYRLPEPTRRAHNAAAIAENS